MFWLTKFFTKGKTVKDAIKYFHTLNGRMPNNLETIKIKNAFMEQNRGSNVIDITSRIKDEWWKPRPSVKERMGKITSMSDELKKMQTEKEALFPGSSKKVDEDPYQTLLERQGKEIEEIAPPKSSGMQFYTDMANMLKKHRREQLELEYDTMFNKILDKAKRIEADPKVLLEAELGTKLTGEETTTKLLDLFSKRPKKASGGIAGQLHLYDGGRANYDKGGMSRRKFLQLFGGLASVPLLGKFFKLAKPASKAVTPAAEVITRGADGIPDYAWDLINVVKAKGTRDIMEGVARGVPVQKKYTYKGVEVIEDGTGGVSVRKEQTKTGHWYDEATDDSFVDDYVDREIGFEIKEGGYEQIGNPQFDDAAKSVKLDDEYVESTAKMQGDPEGGMDVSEVLEYIDDADHLELKKIADESLIKKASGGRVDLSKGGLAHVLGV